MDDLREMLIQKKNEISDIIGNAESFLKKAPIGDLLISNNKNTDQYYLRSSPKDKHGTYIRKKEKELIHQLAQKDYLQKLLVAAKKDLNNIECFLSKYNDEELHNIYNNLSLSKRKLVTPYLMPEKEFVAQWEQKTYTVRYVPLENEDAIYTEKGEVVRSKSEKILADKLNLLGISYHYEKPLYLKGYGFVYPDFTVLNKRTRKEYYWEHLGLMDNAEYCEKAIKKIESMQKNGIFCGDKLILTYETKMHPLNIKIVESTINKYLL